MDAIVNAIDNTVQVTNDFSLWLYHLALYQIGYYQSLIANVLLKQRSNLIDVYDYIVSFWLNYTHHLYEYMHITDLIVNYNTLFASEIGYLLDVFQMSALLSAFITASLIRFAIRRLPVIG